LITLLLLSYRLGRRGGSVAWGFAVVALKTSADATGPRPAPKPARGLLR